MGLYLATANIAMVMNTTTIHTEMINYIYLTMIDSSGNVTKTYSYDAFGNELNRVKNYNKNG